MPRKIEFIQPKATGGTDKVTKSYLTLPWLAPKARTKARTKVKTKVKISTIPKRRQRFGSLFG
jgi:hypothetical protein